MLKRYIFILCAGFFLILFSLTAEARTNISLSVGVAPPPPANVVMVAPQGYSNCYMTQGVWMGNVWVPSHQECSYLGPSGPSLWVSGYWGCFAIGPGGSCRHWRWYGHHWRGRPYRPVYYHHGYGHDHRHW